MDTFWGAYSAASSFVSGLLKAPSFERDAETPSVVEQTPETKLREQIQAFRLSSVREVEEVGAKLKELQERLVGELKKNKQEFVNAQLAIKTTVEGGREQMDEYVRKIYQEVASQLEGKHLIDMQANWKHIKSWVKLWEDYGKEVVRSSDQAISLYERAVETGNVDFTARWSMLDGKTQAINAQSKGHREAVLKKLGESILANNLGTVFNSLETISTFLGSAILVTLTHEKNIVGRLSEILVSKKALDQQLKEGALSKRAKAIETLRTQLDKLVISLDNDRLTPEQVQDIARRLGELQGCFAQVLAKSN
ncbi:hypothetical protein [Kiloniella litopenaei]|uniref:hypothetical protein n=1 Tax=Kiloniella litopenaei TaxID=1549748 RepID=UPI003BA85A34